MEIIEKKFQTIIVGIELICDEYREKLKKDGYEQHKVNTGPNGEIYSYTYKLKEDVKK